MRPMRLSLPRNYNKIIPKFNRKFLRDLEGTTSLNYIRKWKQNIKDLHIDPATLTARTIKNLIDKDKNQLQLTTRRILSEILKP